MTQCALTVLAKPGGEPIRCRRRVWEQDLKSGVCYSCHPHGREADMQRVVRDILFEYGVPYGGGSGRRQ